MFLCGKHMREKTKHGVVKIVCQPDGLWTRQGSRGKALAVLQWGTCIPTISLISIMAPRKRSSSLRALQNKKYVKSLLCSFGKRLHLLDLIDDGQVRDDRLQYTSRPM